MLSKTIIFLLALQLVSAACFAAGPHPLPEFASEYITRNGLEYTLPKGSFDKDISEHFVSNKKPGPWSIEADFNGDGIQDFAGLLRNAEGYLDVVCIYSADKGYAYKILVKNASEDKGGIKTAVTLEPTGVVLGFPFDVLLPEDRIARLKYPGIHILFFEVSSVLYYWTDRAFEELWTSD